MELLSVIRRWRYRDHYSIREIARRTGLSRNTVRKYLRSDSVEPKFAVPDRPSRLDPYADKLSHMLRQEAGKSRKQKRTVKQLHADLVVLGYDGSHGARAALPRAVEVAHAFEVPLVIVFAYGQNPVGGVTGDTRRAVEDMIAGAARNNDILIPFGTVDPWTSHRAVHRVRTLVRDYGVKGFKFHPNLQEFFPNDHSAYPLYELISAAGLPAPPPRWSTRCLPTDGLAASSAVRRRNRSC